MRRYGKALVDPTRSRTRRVVYGFGGMVGAGVLMALSLVLYGLVLYPFTPSTRHLRQMKVQQPSVLLTADGEVLRDFRRYNRQWVRLRDVSPHVVDALIATEDHRFREHGGIDVRRLVASSVYTVLGDRQGGSTITMQLARNLYPRRIGRSSSVTRKMKEIVTAFKIERAYEKDEILETYLNTVPFLYNVHGIEMAARTYFGKPARRLDVLESATLVGMLKATSYYNPVRHPERARQRRNVVLGQMVKHGTLTPEQFERLKDEAVQVRFERQRTPGVKAPHFTEYVRGWLEAWADDEGYDLTTSGLRIHTTLDARLQRLAEAAVRRQGQALQDVVDVEWGRSDVRILSESPHDYGRFRRQVEPFGAFWQQPGVLDRFIEATPRYQRAVVRGADPGETLEALKVNASFVDSLKTAKTRLETGFAALDPRTGYVKAWVGSRSYAQDKFDHVAQARRQPGSTFKPFVYATALEAGYSPYDTFPDRAVEIRVNRDQIWRPVNAGGFSGRDLTLREGLVHSKNSITAQLIDKVGPRRTARTARRMGIVHSALQPVPSLALGTSEVTLLEMVSAYATIAAKGVYRPPIFVARIEDADGTILYEAPQASRQVLSERSARALNDMMRGVIDEGTGRRIRSVFGLRGDVAGKTGTTQDNADGWFLLMHPHLVGGAWIGFNDPRVRFRSDYWGQGAHNALYVVGDFFRHALRQGRLDPRPSLGPTPVFEEHKPSFFARAGEWLTGAFERIKEQFQQDQEPMAEERTAPSPPERRTRPVEFRRPEPDRRAVSAERRRQQLEDAAHALGRVAGVVSAFLEQHDEEAAEAVREQVQHYAREVERYLRKQEHRRRFERRRHAEEHLEEQIDELLDRYVAELDREQRRKVEHFLRELQRGME